MATSENIDAIVRELVRAKRAIGFHTEMAESMAFDQEEREAQLDALKYASGEATGLRQALRALGLNPHSDMDLILAGVSGETLRAMHEAFENGRRDAQEAVKESNNALA